MSSFVGFGSRFPVRQWALIGPADAGKSTFTAANARPPLYVIDSDNKFGSVAALVPGGQASRPEDQADCLDPLRVWETTKAAVAELKPKSILVDSVTRIYQPAARVGHMKNLAGEAKNKAASMQDKANAMTLINNLASLGPDIYYVWHEGEGRDGAGKLITREVISGLEKERLRISLNAELHFIRDNGRYGVRIEWARDFGATKANVGFTLWDKTGNYWRGAAARLEELMFTSFAGAGEAITWGMKQLATENEAEVKAMYEEIKNRVKPTAASAMFVAWIMAVWEKTGK